ncbi:MAG TPA: polysaccharide deacetylase family protein [Bacteroidales bacterium]|nr:polysaccharide deacetylase family protein [Bacteroidales bacterium]HQJ21489.1 polysaccharide deacetylase family protein [Bacteroidales bacterium]
MTDYYKAPVIYYHSVGPVNDNWIRKFLTTDFESFQKQIEWIRKKFKLISFKELWQIRNGIIPPVKNALILNFDDGYLDNWIWVFPLLKKFGLKATIFISPEFVDQRPVIRPNLEDVWNGNAGYHELNEFGFLSWEELKIMEQSGVMDVQSHTLTHTKYFVSDILTGFHHPGCDILYPAGNLFPERKPFYINDKTFENILPYGYPLFEEKSALIARKVEINPDFIEECVSELKKYDFRNYRFETAFNLVKPVYELYKKGAKIITYFESQDEYIKRAKKEISESKKIIEDKLGKKVEFLCWPHGDNNNILHQLALNAGYLMTTTGKYLSLNKDITRIPERTCMDFKTFRKKQKTIFKLKALSGRLPYYYILNNYRKLKDFI